MARMEPLSASLIGAAAKGATPLVPLLTKYGQEAYAKLASKFQSCFQGHIEATQARCSKMKNVLYRDNAVDFLSQYVGVKFAQGSQQITDRQALSSAISGERILLSGTAGAGKTMFLRWSTLDLLKRIKHHGRIPLYLEMRYFQKEYAKRPLELYIFENTSSKEDTSSFPEFLEGLKSGAFIVMLDAVDEINPAYREDVVRNILSFLQSYPRCGAVISSRPDDKLESIQEFSVLRTLPMDQDQIISVINKLEYDSEVKSKLIERLENGLYTELNEFLSNPLLATIMLLSFDHSADIPTKLTSFYQQAFIALYQRHDAAKGAYKRDHHAALPLDRFQEIFSTFSFQTYLDYKFEFSDSELVEAFSAACEYVGEESSPEAIIRDSMESVCLLQREGLDNVFAHRSFQEYFCALFISKYREADARSIIQAIARMENRSNVLKMLVEISPEVFEYEWLAHKLSDFVTKVRRVRLSTKTGLKNFFADFCSSLDVGEETGTVQIVTWTGFMDPDSNSGKWMSITQDAYGQRLKFFQPIFNQQIWPPNTDFSFIPEEVRPSPEYIETISRPLSPSKGKSDQQVMRVGPNDAPWLIHTELPKIFDEIRLYAIGFHRELESRRSARRTTVKSLLSKPKRRGLRPRPTKSL